MFLFCAVPAILVQKAQAVAQALADFGQVAGFHRLMMGDHHVRVINDAPQIECAAAQVAVAVAVEIPRIQPPQLQQRIRTDEQEAAAAASQQEEQTNGEE